MEYEWTLEGYGRTRDQGVTAEEVHAIITGPGRRLRWDLEEDGDTIVRLVGTAGGRLIEVWLVENRRSGVYEVLAGFEAGMEAQARWKNLGEE